MRVQPSKLNKKDYDVCFCRMFNSEIYRLELPEKNKNGWFVPPTIIAGLPDDSRYLHYKFK